MARTLRRLLVCTSLVTLPMACVDGNAPELTAQGGAPDEVEETRAAISVAVSQTILDAFGASLRDDLLTPYYPTAHDGSYGGFIEDRNGTWGLQQDGDKFLVAQARYTWTAAKAAMFFATSNPSAAAQYRASAAVGFAFLQKMWRGSTGGFAMMADRNGGNLRDNGKEGFTAYGNSFGMYAAAAYYAASGDSNALTLAVDAFWYIETNFFDPAYWGYTITKTDKRKESNTNVHILEALVELYKDMPANHSSRSRVGTRLDQLLTLFHDNVIHCPATNDCFAYPMLNQDWSGGSNTVSFGHDLELVMLMVEGIAALGQDPLASPKMGKLKKVVDFMFSHQGYRSDGGLYYNGTYSNGTVSINDWQLQWWPQAEGLAVLCKMRSLYPNEPNYDTLISKNWGYINSQFIDHTNHGWVRQAGDWNIAKAWEWHSNYHAGRAMMNCLTWLAGSCTPNTCSSLGAACGSPSDGCGGTLSCGTCATGTTCNASYQCVASCTPSTCASLGAVCGSASDGCGGTLSCGTCATGKICNSSNQCVTPTNTAPVVNAGPDRSVSMPSTLSLAGTATDDGLPTPATLTITWSRISGPGSVTFSPANAASTTVSFTAAGTYVLRLTASDGALSTSDEVQVVVSPAGNNPCDGICSNPTTFTINGSYSSGNLGTGNVCRQTTSPVHGGNCGNFAGTRSLSVNGTKMSCSGGNWSSLPATRNGGYCITTTAGDYAWAYLTLW